jgi:hypothetical protein
MSDSLKNSFDKLFMITAQNVLGTNVEVCKWSFLFIAFGVAINSYYLIKMSNDINISKTKINLLLNESKIIIEGNITIYEIIKSNSNNLDLSIENKKSEKDTDLLDYDSDCYYMEGYNF